uniref:RiboL-PSP-HEPN domain-containing protein n=1 Tax=mine drainage metagenome TaxID=410659 RepID=E6QPW1_9ZZZZ
MHSALIQFQENLKRARELGALALAVESVTTSIIDVSDMWRAQIVLVVSALDHFIHDVTRLGMIEISKGSRQKTDAYLRFQMPFTAIESALNGMPHENWVGETVREKLSWQSFQDPDKLAEAIRLISVVKLWEVVGVELTMSAADVKTRLRLIVERRNKIAHEADLDPANPGFRWPINADMAADTINFIEHVGEVIFKVAV